MNFSNLKLNKIGRLPKTAGVYCFRDGKKILYIGKAVNLQERVKQHKELLSLAKQLGYLKTDSEIEALILEANLIKKYQPKYNVVWKDDKNYFFVGITKEDFPRIFITHQKKENARHIGPFIEGTSLKRTLTFLRKVLPYYTAKKHPSTLCPWCHLNLCPGPNPIKSEYQKNIKNLISVLEGKSKTVLKNLQREMKSASISRNFEKAAEIRDKLSALEKIMAHAKILEQPRLVEEDKSSSPPFAAARVIEAYDVSNIQGEEATGAMVTFIAGQPAKNFYRKFKIKTVGEPNDVAMLKEVLSRRFKHLEWPYPNLMLIDGGKAQLNAARDVLNQHKSALKSAKISVLALAKKKNELYAENQKKPTLLKTLPREIFNLILQLRDEAHRFAISYHHKLRKKGLLGD